jgi:hypothetical protein
VTLASIIPPFTLEFLQDPCLLQLEKRYSHVVCVRKSLGHRNTVTLHTHESFDFKNEGKKCENGMRNPGWPGIWNLHYTERNPELTEFGFAFENSESEFQ